MEAEFNRLRNRFEIEVKNREEAEKKNSEYEVQLRETGNFGRKIAEYENKIAVIDQER